MRSFEKGKVSILTPCYNGERFLDRYFSAIYDQTYDKIELILILDQKCTDNSERICVSWIPKINKRGYDFRYILQKKTSGVGGAINEGLPYVTGEFLTWPDCDDTLTPTSIEKKVEFLNQNPDYAMVRSDYVLVNETEPDVIIGCGSDRANIMDEYIFDDLIFEKTFVTPGCYMVRSSLLFERIPSGEIYWQNNGGQNWQLLLPCSYKNKTGFIDECLYKYYIHQDSHSHRIDGDKYSSLKQRYFRYQEILCHVINDFHLLSEDERAYYLAKIDLKYSIIRLNLALYYNKSDEAKAEIQALRRMNGGPNILQQLFYHLCRIGISRGLLKGYSVFRNIYRVFRKNLKSAKELS